MASHIKVLQTPSFKKSAKKLHKNQKADLDKAVKALMLAPLLGEQKKEIYHLFEFINSRW